MSERERDWTMVPESGRSEDLGCLRQCDGQTKERDDQTASSKPWGLKTLDRTYSYMLDVIV